MTIPRTATVILLPRRKWSFPLPAETERGTKDEERKTGNNEGKAKEDCINFIFNHKIITDPAICSLVNSTVLSTIIESEQMKTDFSIPASK